MSPFTFNTAPSLVVGSGSIARLGEIAAQRLGPRVLLVTDAGLVKAGLIAPARHALEEAGIAVDVFDGVLADPPEEVVLRDAQGKDAVIPRGEIEGLQPTQKSLMPEGLLRDLTAQEAADLLTYLESLKP